MLGLKIDFKKFFKRFYIKAFDEEDLPSNAAQVGFYFTFALFPLLLFLLSLFAIILTSADEMRAQLFLYLRRMMPDSAYDLVFKTIGEITENSSGSKLTIGILAALWAASAGIDSIRVALNGVYNLTENRPWWKTKLLALILTFGLAALVMIALGVVFYGGKFISLILGTINFTISSPFFLGILQGITVLAVLVTIFAIIYNVLPDHTKSKWVWITPGAIVGIILWLLLSYGFRLYLGYFNSYDKTYGSLGAVIILMLWLYLTAFVILTGGTINAVLQEFSDPEAAEAAARKAEAKEVVEDPESKKAKKTKPETKGLPKRKASED
ncbi:MAG TPA: YihY/virulence factor BrkB family protein [Pyrinomonadaceae bacterium]|jgi:membrane protein